MDISLYRLATKYVVLQVTYPLCKLCLLWAPKTADPGAAAPIAPPPLNAALTRDSVDVTAVTTCGTLRLWAPL